MKIVLAVLLGCLAFGPKPAAAELDWGSIGIAWDAAGLECNKNQAPGTDGSLYVLGFLTGQVAGGTTGAELRVAGFPPEWYVISVTPNPLSNVTIGNPLAEGCNIAFPTCQTGTSGVVLLYTIHFYAPVAVSGRVVTVASRTPPSNANLPCPMLFICDEPCFCLGCSGTRGAAIDDPSYCLIAVQPRSWSQVRSLFR